MTPEQHARKLERDRRARKKHGNRKKHELLARHSEFMKAKGLQRWHF